MHTDKQLSHLRRLVIHGCIYVWERIDKYPMLRTFFVECDMTITGAPRISDTAGKYSQRQHSLATARLYAGRGTSRPHACAVRAHVPASALDSYP